MVSHIYQHLAAEIFQKALIKVNDWTQNWGFQLSTSKTVSILFRPTPKADCRPLRLYINEELLDQVKHVKFLGITFDEYLTWDQHINELTQRCKKDLNILRMLSHTKWGSSKEMLLLLYKSLIKSKLHYGAEAWCDTSQTNIHKLKTIQNQAYRYISGCLSGTSMELVRHELGELPLEKDWEDNITNYIDLNIFIHEKVHEGIAQQAQKSLS